MKFSENYYWRNKKKFQQDHNKLERFFWKTNVNFSKILNIYHKTNYSKKIMEHSFISMALSLSEHAL